MTIRHGGSSIPPTRLCTCGHNYSVHRYGGPCRVASGCTCPQFTEAGPLSVRDGEWMTRHRRPRQRPARQPH